MDKKGVIDCLEEMALLLELVDANVFKIRAFQNAARALENEQEDLSLLAEEGKLETIKGIGKGIAAVITDLYHKGKSKEHQALRRQFPETLFDLFKIPGLGPKKVKKLYDEIDIKSVGELEYACTENRLIDLDGFGTKSQDKVLQGIRHFKKSAGFYLIDNARPQASRLLSYLKKQKGVLKAEIAGSIRRHKETIRDMDILVASNAPEKVHAAFMKYPEIEAAVASGETKSSVTLKSGMNCDLRTVTLKEFPFALYYFTGSKEHNVAVRSIAKKKGYKINEYGLYRGKKQMPCADEAGIFKTLGLHYVPPELRENTGEIEWAQKKAFPRLIEEKDIRGIFHVHTTYSDGRNTLEEMIAKAQGMGFEYIGISDHSQTAVYAKGLKAPEIEKQWKEIDKLQKKFRIRIFKGIESDILADGKLDYPDSLLKEFDFVIGSVHSRFNIPVKEMTRRICRAMDNRYLTFVGHPTGRLLLGRAGYEVDMFSVIGHAAQTEVSLELNASPHRLDLDWRLCRTAKNKKVLLGIHPDAHSLEGLNDVAYGVGIARKGWLEKSDVVNAMSVNEVEKFLKKRR